MLKKYFTLLVISFTFISFSSAYAQGSPPLYEFGFSSGYIIADLKDDNLDEYSAIPLFFHFGYNINQYVGLNNHKGVFQLALEPFLHAISQPNKSVNAGFRVMMKYSYPVLEKLTVYTELGAGPMYFGAKTVEQGKKGFNFNDAGGVGLQYFINDNKAITFGYRRHHISNLGIRKENGGVTGDSVVLGMSVFY